MEKSTEKRRISRTGIVISDAMDKTVVVQVERRYPHPVYKRIIRRSIKFLCHDEQDRCGVGDKVRIEESRPLSRRKRWRVKEVLVKAK
jgi:small subunit ribosomal protein S17